MGQTQSRSTDSQIFSEDDFNSQKTYKLPVKYDRYLYVAVYRRRSRNNYTTILESHLWEEKANNTASSSETNVEKYPFHKLIENSVLPYIGDDSREKLMKKHSKSVNSKRSSEVTDLSIEEFHFIHPNDEGSTINIDVMTIKRRQEEDQEEEVVNDNFEFEDIEIVGAVCDSVTKEVRRNFMNSLKEYCENILLELQQNAGEKTLELEDQTIRNLMKQKISDLETNNCK